MSDILSTILASESQQPTGSEQAAPVQSTEATAQGRSVDSDFLERFNRLASKEASLRKREQEMKAQGETWKQKVERLERLERLREEDPEAALSELGLDYDKLTERRLKSFGSEQDKTLNTMQKELQALKDQLANKDKAAEEERVSAALQGVHKEVRQICNTDEFELIQANESYDLVLDTAAEYYQATGKMISLADAAKHVEAHLEQKLERILAAKKVANRIKPRQEEPDANIPAQLAPESKSLSTSMSQSAKPSGWFSEEDLRQAAIRTLRGS